MIWVMYSMCIQKPTLPVTTRSQKISLGMQPLQIQADSVGASVWSKNDGSDYRKQRLRFRGSLQTTDAEHILPLQQGMMQMQRNLSRDELWRCAGFSFLPLSLHTCTSLLSMSQTKHPERNETPAGPKEMIHIGSRQRPFTTGRALSSNILLCYIWREKKNKGQQEAFS